MSLAGDTGTVEGFTSDGLSVVVLLDDGTKVYARAKVYAPAPLLAGITAREDLYPCVTAAPVCTGRGTERIA